MTATASTDMLIGYAYLAAGCVWLWRNVRNSLRVTDDAWWVL